MVANTATFRLNGQANIIGYLGFYRVRTTGHDVSNEIASRGQKGSRRLIISNFTPLATQYGHCNGPM